MNKTKVIAILIILGGLYNSAYPLARTLSRGFPTRNVYQSERFKPNNTRNAINSIALYRSSKTQRGTPPQSAMVSSFWNRAIEKGKQASQSLKNLAQQWKSYLIKSNNIPNSSADYVPFYPQQAEKKVISEKEELLEKISYLVEKIFDNPERRKDVLMQIFIPALIKAKRIDEYREWDQEKESFELGKWAKANIVEENYKFKLELLSRLFLAGRPDLSESSPFRSGSYEIRFLSGFAKWLFDFDEKGNVLLNEIIKPIEIKDRSDQW